MFSNARNIKSVFLAVISSWITGFSCIYYTFIPSNKEDVHHHAGKYTWRHRLYCMRERRFSINIFYFEVRNNKYQIWLKLESSRSVEFFLRIINYDQNTSVIIIIIKNPKIFWICLIIFMPYVLVVLLDYFTCLFEFLTICIEIYVFTVIHDIFHYFNLCMFMQCALHIKISALLYMHY